MKSKILTLLFIFTLFPAIVVGDNHSAIGFNAVYLIESNGSLIAQTNISLKKVSQNQYLYSSFSKPRGFFSFFVSDEVEEQSRWIFHNRSIRPVSYLYHRHGGRKDKRVELQFDWEHMKVKNQVNGHDWQMEINEGVIDKFSVNLAVRLRLKNHNPDLNFMVADGGKLKPYNFTKLGIESIATSFGNVEAIKVQRQRKGKETTLIWFAPKYNYYPIKIKRIDRHGDVLDMTASSISSQ